MKRFLAMFLICTLFLSTCGWTAGFSESSSVSEDCPVCGDNLWSEDIEETPLEVLEELNADHVPELYVPDQHEFNSLGDSELLTYLEDQIAASLSSELDSSEYIVQNVSVSYISKEYIDELSYNSQVNVFFGYTLAELDEQFQGTRYVFTLDDNGDTVVREFEAYDDTYDQIIKNVAIGTGIILVCVTVSIVTYGTGAPAVSMIFAASAKSAATVAVSSGAISGIITTGLTAYQTGNWNDSIKAGALSASDSFKWGAITGGITGGVTELVTLKTAAKGGLTMNQAATIIKEKNLPANFLKQIHSMEEYEELLKIADKAGMTIEDLATLSMTTGYPLDIIKMIRSKKEGTLYFKDFKLIAKTVGGKTALIRPIDLNYKSELGGEIVTNLERMQKGYAAIDPLTGQAYELHHVGQSINSPLAILTRAEHKSKETNAILHDSNIADGQGVHALLSDAEWSKQRKAFWKAMAELMG